MGAAPERLVEDWYSGDLTADQAIYNNFRTTRNRARDLERNDSYVRRFLAMVASNVFGHQGIRLKPEARREPGGALDVQDNALIRAAWQDWGRVGECTLDGRLAWVECETMVLRRVLVDGEALIRKVRGRGKYGLQLQMIDAELLDERKNQSRGRGRAKIVMGVELDGDERPVAYYIQNAAGMDLNLKRVPADEIIHVYIQERPHQTRGLTWLASTGVRKKMLDGFEEAATVAARAGAAKMGFFTSEEGSQYKGSGRFADGATQMEINPGSWEVLPPGMMPHDWDPTWPAVGVAEFEKEIKRGIASGLNVNYTTLANDLEGVNYSSIRQGELADRDFWRCLQWFMVRHCSDLVQPEWLLMAITTQALPLPIEKFEKFSEHSWRPRGWSWVDPAKEIKAAREAFLLGVRSLTDIVAEQGGEFEEVARQIAEDRATAERLGITLPENDDGEDEEPVKPDTDNE